MFFHKIELYNMFSYQGKQVFDLTRNPEDREKTVVLIHGNNGNGKTCFLRSMKLLFGGISDSLRSEVTQGRKLSLSEFVYGDGVEWNGILNLKHVGAQRCFIMAEWHEHREHITVTREWDLTRKLNAHALHGSIRIEIKPENQTSQILENERAKHYLDRILPSAFIPFFFFDGEQIANLAEARSKEESEKIESLLKIAPIKSLDKALTEIRRKLQESAYDSETSGELNSVEGRLKALGEETRNEAAQIKDLEFEESRLQAEVLNKESERAVY